MNCLSKKWLKLGLFEKVQRKSYLKKTLIGGLELAETLTEKRTREYKARLVLNLKRLAKNRKV